jgi:hypothetical protein
MHATILIMFFLVPSAPIQRPMYLPPYNPAVYE